MSVIVILNFQPAPPITEEQEAAVVSGIVGMMRKEYVCQMPESRVIDVPLVTSLAEMMLSIPLAPSQWSKYAVVARFLPDHPMAYLLHQAVDRVAGLPEGQRSPHIVEADGEFTAVETKAYLSSS